MSSFARISPRRLLVVLAVAAAALFAGVGVSDRASNARASAGDDTAGRTWSRIAPDPYLTPPDAETQGRTWS